MNTTRALVRTLATSSSRMAAKDKVHPGYQKIRAKMAEFQIDNGQPIHLKGGVGDNLLVMSTIGLCGVGLFMCFQFYYSMAFPPKNN